MTATAGFDTLNADHDSGEARVPEEAHNLFLPISIIGPATNAQLAKTVLARV